MWQQMSVILIEAAARMLRTPSLGCVAFQLCAQGMADDQNTPTKAYAGARRSYQ